MGLNTEEDPRLLLDEKLLSFMDLLELLEEKRKTLNCLIEEGWFSISKARYSMGNKQVSALQYASDMEPLVRVHVTNLDDNNVGFCTERSTEKCCEISSKDDSSVEEIGPQDQGIRQRKKTQRAHTIATRAEKAPAKNKDDNSHQDPLKWFGILVPQPLKQAQGSFKQVIQLSAEIAELQISVLNTRQELKDRLTILRSAGLEPEDAAAPSATET